MTIPIPAEVIERLKLFCEENDLAMLSVATDPNIIVLGLGPKIMHPDQWSVIVAYMLLEGVVNGHADKANAEQLARQAEEPVMKPN